MQKLQKIIMCDTIIELGKKDTRETSAQNVWLK